MSFTRPVACVVSYRLCHFRHWPGHDRDHVHAALYPGAQRERAPLPVPDNPDLRGGVARRAAVRHYRGPVPARHDQDVGDRVADPVRGSPGPADHARPAQGDCRRGSQPGRGPGHRRGGARGRRASRLRAGAAGAGPATARWAEPTAADVEPAPAEEEPAPAATATTTAAPAHVATVERGRIASLAGVVSLIWLVILVLMVWNS